MSSKLLLTLFSKSVNLYIDSTFRFIQGGYPVLVDGFTFMNQRFIPITIGVMRNGHFKSNLLVFNTLNNELLKNGLNWSAKTIMVDFDEGISKAKE
ncbi:hypothetical protein AYI68_g5747 [Smittium mucronatum]|uniref:MULE transposase domain-containing protein n=1 Tax=Smittium mucronatum TaxID=133383 RepID=A0A1R0GTD5_9FUNG|nr:hypothetical protein AYI68_g5747 [Smittium mucronatum]